VKLEDNVAPGDRLIARRSVPPLRSQCSISRHRGTLLATMAKTVSVDPSGFIDAGINSDTNLVPNLENVIVTMLGCFAPVH